MDLMRGDDPVAVTLVQAIRAGDLDALSSLLAAHAGLASAAIGNRDGWRTPLHVVTDWPGYFPNGPAPARIVPVPKADWQRASR